MEDRVPRKLKQNSEFFSYFSLVIFCMHCFPFVETMKIEPGVYLILLRQSSGLFNEEAALYPFFFETKFLVIRRNKCCSLVLPMFSMFTRKACSYRRRRDKELLLRIFLVTRIFSSTLDA